MLVGFVTSISRFLAMLVVLDNGVNLHRVHVSSILVFVVIFFFGDNFFVPGPAY